jgi:hypothetical protein
LFKACRRVAMPVDQGTSIETYKKQINFDEWIVENVLDLKKEKKSEEERMKELDKVKKKIDSRMQKKADDWRRGD